MTPMHSGEPQTRYVERVLRTEGRISAWAALYDLQDDSGHKRSITRLAAIIEPLRKAGWTIETEGGHGELATYVVKGVPDGRMPRPAARAEWICSQCGADARMTPTLLLAGMGEAWCPSCGKSRLFKRNAA